VLLPRMVPMSDEAWEAYTNTPLWSLMLQLVIVLGFVLAIAIDMASR
jgi:hypothetical protein